MSRIQQNQDNLAKVNDRFQFARMIERRPERTFVAYAGADRYPLSEKVEVVGVRELAGMLRAL